MNVRNRTTSVTWAALASIFSATLLMSAFVMPAHAAQNQLTVNAYTTGGKAISMYATVKSGDTIVKSGFTPFTYTGTTGNTYSVEASNYSGLTFSKWGDGTTSNPRSIALFADTTATAYYSEGAVSPASSCNTVEPAATAASGNDGNVPANTDTAANVRPPSSKAGGPERSGSNVNPCLVANSIMSRRIP